jgi:hypothetical protein
MSVAAKSFSSDSELTVSMRLLTGLRVSLVFHPVIFLVRPALIFIPSADVAAFGIVVGAEATGAFAKRF